MIETVKILGIDYSVSFRDTEKSGEKSSCGHVNNTLCMITIDSEMNCNEHKTSVLLHEIIEALNYRLELDLDHSKITCLEAGLIQVFYDNPGLVKLL